MKIDQKFPRKRAFITGAASGLGLAIGERLAASGWKLLIADINEQKLVEAETRLQENWGGVDMVFNNAGIATAGAIDELSMEDWQRTIDIDLWNVIHGCRIFVPMLKRQGSGHIINTASSAGTLAAPEMAAYNVAKAGVVSLSETLKPELSGDNIGVTVICPTVFVTSLGDNLTAGTKMEQKLMKQLQASKVSAQDIVDDVISAIERNRLYVMTQADAKWGWRLKRFFPELFTNFVAYCYRNQKWIFAD